MFGKSKDHTPMKRIDSLIGAGTTLTGDIVFTGGLRIDGTGDVVDGDGLPPGELNRIEAALRRKYTQYEYTPVFRDRATLLRIRPERHLAWSARSLDWDALAAPRVSP